MGFFDFLRGKERKAEPKPGQPVPEQAEAMEIPLGEVREVVEKSISEGVGKEKETAEELYDRIKFNLLHIRKMAAELEKKTFERGDKRYAPVNMVKDNYVRKTLSLLSSVPVVGDFGYQEIMDFCSRTGKIIREMQDIPPKQTILLSKYFKDETSRIIKLLKETEEKRNEMSSLVEGKSLWVKGRLDSGVERISELVKKAKDMEKEGDALHEGVKAKKREMGEREKELEEFVSGEEFRGFENLGKEAGELENERARIENEIREEISSVKRPLKKLEYAVTHEKGMGKERVSLFSRIAHSPVKILFQEQGDSVLMEALVRLRDFDLKDDEKERVEELIKKIELGYLSKLKDRYEWLEGEIREKKERGEKSDIPERKKAMERGIENLKREISGYEKEREKVIKSRDETYEEAGREKKGLEDFLVKEINIKLNIIV